MNHRDVVLALFGIVVLLLVWILYRLQKNEADYKSVDLVDLIMENGRVSRIGVTWCGAFVVMTFGFVYLLVHDKLDAGYVTAYTGAWVAPIIVKMFAGGPAKPVEPMETIDANKP